MDLDHLKKLVDACIEEAESTNDTLTTYPVLVAYLDVETNRKPLHEAARKESFVQGFLRGNMAASGVTIRDASDETLLKLLKPAGEAYVEMKRERGR